MKNNIVKNKRLLSVISIGISAMMVLQTPMTAYAGEGDILNDTGNQQEETISSRIKKIKNKRRISSKETGG